MAEEALESLSDALAERFGSRNWESLRQCRLCVGKEGEGAGLDLEQCEFGFQVEAIHEKPGQDPKLAVGDVVVSIGGTPLIGLDEEPLASTFGSLFCDGARLLLIEAKELESARIGKAASQTQPEQEEEEEEVPVEQLANYELLHRTKSSHEYDAVVKIPVGRGTVWMLDVETLASFQNDLVILGQKFGLAAEPHCQGDGIQSVKLSGLSTSIAAARPEVIQLLQFYRQREWGGDGGAQFGGDAALGKQENSEEPGVVKPLDPANVETSSAKILDRVKDLRQFQYHDHTADIIVHSWGRTRAEAFAQVVTGMFNYMTPLDKIEVTSSVEVEATGRDLLDLLYHLLDEFLVVFGTTLHVSRCIEILDFDEDSLCVRARGYGERMDLQKHEQGTEIKAITMHMMRILTPDVVVSENGTADRLEAGEEVREGFPHEAYVLLDI